jgi:hypothetical protein
MNTRALLKRATAAALLSATLAAPGVVGLTAATANAMPISTLKSECQGANNGRWVTDYSGGRVIGYYCYYSSISGNTYVDYYDRYGNYRWSG